MPNPLPPIPEEDWLAYQSEKFLYGAKAKITAAKDALSGNDLLSAIGSVAKDVGLGDEGARVAQAIAVTEGALRGAVGDEGQSFGPFQFYTGGQLPNFANAMGMSVSEAAQYARENPLVAARWALTTYLGGAIKDGLAKGLSGSNLATYAQRYGQVSVSPERAGQNYDNLFGGGQTGPVATTVDLSGGQSGEPVTFRPQQATGTTAPSTEPTGGGKVAGLPSYVPASARQTASAAQQEDFGTYASRTIGDTFSGLGDALSGAAGQVGGALDESLGVFSPTATGMQRRVQGAADLAQTAQQTAGDFMSHAQDTIGGYLGGVQQQIGNLPETVTPANMASAVSPGMAGERARAVGDVYGTMNEVASGQRAQDQLVTQLGEAGVPGHEQAGFTLGPDQSVQVGPRELIGLAAGMTLPVPGEFGKAARAGEAAAKGITEGARIFTGAERAAPDVVAGINRRLTQVVGSEGELLTTTAGKGAATVVAKTGVSAAVPELAQEGTTMAEKVAAINQRLGSAAARNLPNLTKLDAPPETIASIVRTAQENPELMNAARQGVVTHQQVVEDLAPRLGMTAEDFLKTPVGRAFNQTEMTVLRAAVVSKTDDAVQMAQRVYDQGGVDALNPVEKAQAIQTLVDAASLQATARGAAATAGRTLNAMKITINQAMAKAITGSNERVAAERALAAATTDAERAAAQARLNAVAETAGKVTGRQIAQAQEALNALGKNVTDKMLNEWVTVQQSGDPLAMAKFIKGLQKPSWWGRLTILRYGSMLSATSTHMLNAVSNVINVGLDVAARPVSAGVDVIASRLQDRARTRYLAETAPMLRGLAAGARTGLQEAAVIMRDGINPSEASKLDRIRPGLQSGSAVVDTVFEWPLRALTASDAIFRGMARSAHVQALAMRQAIREGLDGAGRAARVEEIVQNLGDYPELMAEAEQAAARTVYQESRKGASWAMQIRNVEGLGPVSEVLVPFIRTPYNIAAQGVGMSPAGYIGAFQAFLKAKSARQLGDIAGAQKMNGEMVDRIARATLGSAVLGWAALEASQGGLTGPYPTDQQTRSTLPPGWQPWSFVIHDPINKDVKYVPFQNLGAFGVPLAVAALAFAPGSKGNTWADVGPGRVVAGVGKYMVDQSFLQGVSQTLDALNDPAHFGEKLVSGTVTQLMPMGALQRQISRALEQGARDPKNAIESLLAMSPATSGMVQPRLDSLGRPREYGQTGWSTFLAPVRFDVERTDPVLAELRQYQVGVPGRPRTEYGVPLTEDEQRRMQQLTGEEIVNGMQKLMKLPQYQKAGFEAKQAYIEKVVSGARDIARKRWAQEVGPAKVQQRRQEALRRAG